MQMKSLSYRKRAHPKQAVPLAAAVALALGLLFPASVQAEDGAALFEKRCADCHGPRDIAHWTRQNPDTEQRKAWMNRFLERHYPPPEDERAAIIEHIEDVIAGQTRQ